MNSYASALSWTTVLILATPTQAATQDIFGSDVLHQVTNFMLRLDPSQLGANATPGFATADDVRDYVVARTGLAASHPLVTSLMGQHGRICGQINYPLKSSDDGENAMCANTQEVAPMSRRLGAKFCVDSAADDCFEQAHGGSPIGPLTAVNRTIAWHALTIVRSATPTMFNGCDDLGRRNSCAPGLRGWQNKLGVIYAGVNYTSNATASGAGTFASCDHPDRRALVGDWSELLNGCTAEDTFPRCLAGLRHALRRPDTSATTSLFRDFIGINPPAGTTGFCNGAQTQDNDPIRINCRVTSVSNLANQNERFCPDIHIGGNAAPAYQGSLGVVLPIFFEEFAPGTMNLPAKVEAVHDNRPCTVGSFFSLAAPPCILPAGTCPNGDLQFPPGFCRWPYRVASELPGLVDFGCNNSRTNLPAGSPPGADGRRYNEWYRQDNGNFVYTAPCTERKAKFSRTSVNCSHDSATDQIGCIVASQKCFIGFAGREVLLQPNTLPLQAQSSCSDCAAGDDSVPPWGERTDIGHEGEDCTKADAFEERCTIGCYPMRGKFFLNSLSGFFSAFSSDERSLRDCYFDNNFAAMAVRAHGLEPVAVQENQVACMVCGNGIVEADELCDDGNEIDDDACGNDCQP